MAAETLIESASVPPYSRNLYEFRDTRLSIQIALGAAGAACLAAAVGAFRTMMAGELLLAESLGATSIALLVAMGLAYWKFGSPDVLRLSDDQLTLIRGGRETSFPLSDLESFSANWIDYYRQGVYHQTHVDFRFTFDNSLEAPLSYRAQAVYQTSKFESLEQFQSHLSELIAPRLRDELESSGRVRWTERIAILCEGIEFQKKPGAEPKTIYFSQITHWEVDQGLFKLAFDGNSKPNIVEPTKQPNFYPGLVLFNDLLAEGGN
jgi:hypothetical protein